VFEPPEIQPTEAPRQTDLRAWKKPTLREIPVQASDGGVDPSVEINGGFIAS
jgi:hypothetical protein